MIDGMRILWGDLKQFRDEIKRKLGLNNVDNTTDANKPISTATQTALDAKQNTLISGTNIKTVNGNSLLGSGNVAISGGGGASNGLIQMLRLGATF